MTTESSKRREADTHTSMRAASVVASDGASSSVHRGNKSSSPIELRRQGFDSVASDLASRERLEADALSTDDVPLNVRDTSHLDTSGDSSSHAHVDHYVCMGMCTLV